MTPIVIKCNDRKLAEHIKLRVAVGGLTIEEDVDCMNVFLEGKGFYFLSLFCLRIRFILLWQLIGVVLVF